jgi:hypothetical protein
VIAHAVGVQPCCGHPRKQDENGERPLPGGFVVG